jgi:hypothetical protein
MILLPNRMAAPNRIHASNPADSAAVPSSSTGSIIAK